MKKVVKAFATESEKEKLVALANETGLSLSKYLIKIGLGYKPKSNFDNEAILHLLKFNADLGRLGGILKMWLSNKERRVVNNQNVEKVILECLDRIYSNQDKIKEILDRF